MEQVRVERLDHFGVMASVIKDIRLIDMIDSRLVPDVQERITPGEAVTGMILNGLGFAKRPCVGKKLKSQAFQQLRIFGNHRCCQ